MTKYFGTDGIRGIVNKDLNHELVTKIGISTVKALSNKNRLTFLVGYDTRVSKDMISNALIGAILSENADVINIGVMPTPAISYLVKEYKCDGAFIISASHNKYIYNGIKILDNNGYKLTEELEDKIEEYIDSDIKKNDETNAVGKLIEKDDYKELYVNHLLSTIDSDLEGLNILVDTANGASYETSKILFNKLKCKKTYINDKPDGYNINENCGSTHIEEMKDILLKGKYDIGISYDGDADRCLLLDNEGNLVDGDFIIAIYSKYLKDNNKLKNNTVVGTIMSNLGLSKYCENNNINYETTKVGDKYVLENMLEHDYIIGGEQSGHIIFKEFANTGDGELTSLQILNIMAKSKKTLKELSSIIKKYPQVLINVDVSKDKKELFKTDKVILDEISKIEISLNGNGRVLVRASGTENLIRVMIEGEDLDIINDKCKSLANLIKERLN